MSLWITFGAAMGCWALLSVLGGERYRMKDEQEMQDRAQQQALLEEESAAKAPQGH